MMNHGPARHGFLITLKLTDAGVVGFGVVGIEQAQLGIMRTVQGA